MRTPATRSGSCARLSAHHSSGPSAALVQRRARASTYAATAEKFKALEHPRGYRGGDSDDSQARARRQEFRDRRRVRVLARGRGPYFRAWSPLVISEHMPPNSMCRLLSMRMPYALYSPIVPSTSSCWQWHYRVAGRQWYMSHVTRELPSLKEQRNFRGSGLFEIYPSHNAEAFKFSLL